MEIIATERESDDLQNVQEDIRKENARLFAELAALQDRAARAARTNAQLSTQISSLLPKRVAKS